MKILTALLAVALAGIIPEPVSLQQQNGKFTLTACSGFCAASPEAAQVAGLTASGLRASTGLKLPVKAGKGNIVLVLDKESGIPFEGYTLKVGRNKVEARASSREGLFYAMQSFLQLLDGGRKAPCCEISDSPRFQWRGFHIDPCRHFLPVEEVKKQIDILSQYKINRMHWHLTDDQGWRIEIKKYPKLTEVGAWRTEFDGSVYGGFYTQDEIRDVVAYAAERCVTVVPEIEMPGHAISAIRAYPELSCTGETMNTFYTWGTPDVSLCVGSERVFEFLDDVISEVVRLFPSEYIHIGGDECRKNRWETCPKCQARIKEQGIVADKEFTAEEKLQSYAVHRMEGILAKYGRKLIGWDEILEGGLSPNATVMSWRGEKGGVKAAMMGHAVIMTPGSEGMYFDHFQGDPKAEPTAIGHYTTLEKVYAYDPVPQVLKDAGKSSLVKGVQCNNWSEYIYDVSHREYMLFPRAFALAEIAWTQPDHKDWESFKTRVDAACRRLDARGVNYHVPLPEQPGGSCSNLAFSDKTVVELTTTRPEKIVYTLDGSEPTAESAEYKAPIEINRTSVLKTASVTSFGRLSTVRTINATKMEPLRGMADDDVFKGIRARRADGRFWNAAALEGAEWTPIDLKSFRDITALEPYDRNLPDSTRFFAVEAGACFKVKETGVYRFSSDCDRVWIDYNLLIDNSDEPVKRYSRHDAELVLAEGVHNVHLLYIFNIKGGWNPLRNKSEVSMRKPGSEEWKPIKIIEL